MAVDDLLRYQSSLKAPAGAIAAMERRRPAPHPPREEMINTLANNFYINEPCYFVTQHNTDLLVFGSDTHPARQPSLNRKIDRALTYATMFKDVEALNALRYIPAQQAADKDQTTAPKLADPYLTLGLYLYLADACSRLGRKKTFLTAMREAGAERSDDTPQSPGTLFQKTLKALRILRLDDSQPQPDERHEHIIRQWRKTGTFTVEGERHAVDEHGKLHGAYAKLAYDIAHRQDILGMNLPISYALGNRPFIEGKTPKEVYQATGQFTDPASKEQQVREIDKRIESGHAVRRDRLRHLVHTYVPRQPLSAAAPIIARKILALLPDATLEIMSRQGYNIAYAADDDLRRIYPKENIIGVRSGDCKMARMSVGSVQPRHRTLFTCDGIALHHEKDEGVLHQSVAHTLLHESMHMLVGQLKDDRSQASRDAIQALRDAVLAVHNALAQQPHVPGYFREQVKTMDNRTLAQKIDYESRMYHDYADRDKEGKILTDASGTPLFDSRWEEVICNSYSMMHSKSPPLATENPFRHPPEGLKSLRHLAEAIDRSVEQALALARKTCPDEKASSLARA